MSRLTKGDWLAVGREVLRRDGHQALTVDALTSRAGVTKGSFYHHFRGMPGFVTDLLEDLRTRAFADVVSQVDPAASVRDQFGQLVRAIGAHAPDLERAVRRWAVVSPTVAALVADIDQARVAYVRGLFAKVTGDEAQADFLARLNVAFYLGCLEIEPPISGQEYVAMAGALERLLPPPSEEKA